MGLVKKILILVLLISGCGKSSKTSSDSTGGGTGGSETSASYGLFLELYIKPEGSTGSSTLYDSCSIADTSASGTTKTCT